MPPLAIFGIENDTLGLVVGLVLLFLAALWLALAFYTYMDSNRRVGDPMLVGSATVAAVLFPFIGTIVYMIVRPPEYLDDVRERELEIQAMEESLAGERCPVCRADIDPAFLACPVCTTKLKQACRRCKSPLEPLWQVCPYCETLVDTPAALELGRIEPPRRERRERRRQAE